MSVFSELLSDLDRVFGRGAEHDIAEHLFKFLGQYPDTSHITLALVRGLVPDATRGDLDRPIVRTLQYLAGDGVRLLDTRFEYFADDDAPVELSEEEARAAVTDHVNPISGELDDDAEGKVAIYFAPGERFEKYVDGAGEAPVQP